MSQTGETADAGDLKSPPERGEGSNPLSGTLDLLHITELARINFKENRKIARSEINPTIRAYFSGAATAYRRIWKRLENRSGVHRQGLVFWSGPNGSLFCNQDIEGFTQATLDGYFIAGYMKESAMEKLATMLGGEFQEKG